MKRALLLVIGIVSAFTPAAAGPALPDIQGPDVPALSEPAVVVTAFRNAEFSWRSRPRGRRRSQCRRSITTASSSS